MTFVPSFKAPRCDSCPTNFCRACNAILAEAEEYGYKRADARIKELETSLEMSNGCLSMIADMLESAGCCHGHDRSATPPMAYPEWIACVYKKNLADELKKRGIKE